MSEAVRTLLSTPASLTDDRSISVLRSVICFVHNCGARKVLYHDADIVAGVAVESLWK